MTVSALDSNKLKDKFHGNLSTTEKSAKLVYSPYFDALGSVGYHTCCRIRAKTEQLLLGANTNDYRGLFRFASPVSLYCNHGFVSFDRILSSSVQNAHINLIISGSLARNLNNLIIRR